MRAAGSDATAATGAGAPAGTATDAAAAKAPPAWHAPRLDVSLTPKQIHVGDTVTYRIAVTHPNDVSVKLPSSPKLDPYTLNGVDHQTKRDAKNPKQSTEVWTLKLGVYQLGQKPIPALSFDVVTPDGPATLLVPAHPMKVASVLGPDAAKAKPREMAPPLSVWIADYRLAEIGGAILGGLLLALVAALLWRRFRRRKRERAVPPPPPRPLDERALEALRALQAKGLLARGRYREFFFELSEIVRAYVGERFSFEALECTTTELLGRLRDRPTPGLDYAAFERWSEIVDLVKFADQRPTDAECAEALTRAFAVVEQTTRAHAVPPEADAA